MCENCNDSILNPVISTQPFCEQCSDSNNKCLVKFDADCVIYHLPPDDRPTRLVNLGLPNNVSATTIFEKIDDLIGSGWNVPLTVVDSESVDLTSSGSVGHTLKADVKISAETDNSLLIKADGLYVSPGNGKVKVDASDIPDYLINQVVGGTDGVVSVSVIENSGLLQILPSLDIVCLLNEIKNNETIRNLFCSIVALCGSTNSPIPPIVTMDCDAIVVTGDAVLGTPSTLTVTIPVVVTYAGAVTATVVSTNFNGSVTVNVTPSTTQIVVPVSYNGLGPAGVQPAQADITITGTQNVPTCKLDFTVVENTTQTTITVQNMLSAGVVDQFIFNGLSVANSIAPSNSSTVNANTIIAGNPNNLAIQLSSVAAGATVTIQQIRSAAPIATWTISYAGTTTTVATSVTVQDGDLFQVSEVVDYSSTVEAYRVGGTCGSVGGTGFVFNFATPLAQPITISVGHAWKANGTLAQSGATGVGLLGAPAPWSYGTGSDFPMNWTITVPAGVSTYDTGLVMENLSTIFAYPACNSWTGKITNINIYMKVTVDNGQTVVLNGSRAADYWATHNIFQFIQVL